MAEIDIFTTRNRQFKDLSLTFALNPVTNDVVAVTGADAVKRSVRNILLTRRGEVPFLPNYGSRLDALLFEPIDPITTAFIDAEIRGAISAFEPRVKITYLTITPTPDENKYQIDLTMALVNQPEPITLTVFLTRLR